jgi:hypothetical protein
MKPRYIIRSLLGLFCLVLLPHCAGVGKSGAKSAVQEPSEVTQARDAVTSSNDNGETAVYFAEVVSSVAEAQQSPSAEDQRYVQDLSKEGVGYLDQALARTSDPTATAMLNTRKGEMLLLQRDFSAAEAAIKKAIEICPSGVTVEPMLRSLKMQSRESEATKWCTDARAQLCPQADLTKLCDACSRHGAQVCNSPEDQDLLADRDRQRIEAADAEARRGTDTDPNVLLEAVAPITIVNLCPRPVSLFIGEKFVEGSGVRSQIDGGKELTKSLQLHSKIWIVDAEGVGISSIIVKNENPKITINPSGTGFR